MALDRRQGTIVVLVELSAASDTSAASQSSVTALRLRRSRIALDRLVPSCLQAMCDCR